MSMNYRIERKFPGVLMVIRLLVPLAVVATQVDVTWTGASNPSDPSWAVADNWDPTAPDATTAGTIIYGDAGQSVTGRLDAARTIGGLLCLGEGRIFGRAHTLDLGGHRLTVKGNVRINGTAYLLTVTNGILQLGTGDTIANIEIGYSSHDGMLHKLTLTPDVELHPDNVGNLRVGTASGVAWSHGAELDLRGVQLGAAFDRTLQVNEIRIGGDHWSWGMIRLNPATGIDTIVVSNDLGVAWNGSTVARIGDETDGWKLPAGRTLRIGDASGKHRGNLGIGVDGSRNGLLTLNGGAFDAYVNQFRIGQGGAAAIGVLDLTNAANPVIDALVLSVGTTTGGGRRGDGTLRISGGSITARDVEIGNRPYHATTYPYTDTGFAAVALTRTDLVVTNALWIGKNASIVINVGAVSSGIQVPRQDAVFTWHLDEGSSIQVNFLEPPAGGQDLVAALRMKGDRLADLAAMSAAGELTADIAAGISGMKTGAFYDADDDMTTFAMVDETVDLPPVFVVRDATFEVEPGGTVRVDIREVVVAAEDFENRPFTLGMTYGAQIKVTNLSLTAGPGDYTVTVTMTLADDPDPVVYQETVTITLTATLAGTAAGNVTWEGGGAATVLMPRPEWMWLGNWKDGVVPAVETTGTIRYGLIGADIDGRLETNRTVGGLHCFDGGRVFDVDHTLNLGGHKLTLAGHLVMERTDYRFTVTHGVLQLGVPANLARVDLGLATHDACWQRLKLAPGLELHPYIDRIYVGGADSAWASAAELDLRGIRLGDAFNETLTVQALRIRGEHRNGSAVYLDDATGIATLEVLDAFGIACGARNTARIGVASDGWKLPAGLSVRVGNQALDRLGKLHIGVGNRGLDGRLIPQGGDLVLWLSELVVGRSTGGGERVAGTLDARNVGTLSIHAQTVAVGTTAGAGTWGEGQMWLGNGNVTAGDLWVGNQAGGIGHGTLDLNGTVFTMTNTLSVGTNGTIVVTLAGNPGGLILSRDDPGALAVNDGGMLEFHFNARSQTDQLYVGLTWKGEHVTILQALRDAVPARLVIHDGGMAPRTAQIYKYLGSTYVGQLPPAGSLLRVR